MKCRDLVLWRRSLCGFALDTRTRMKVNHNTVRDAIKHGDLNALTALLKQGFDLTHDFKKGWTVFHLVARKGNVEMARVLLQHRADINAENDMSRTPLDEAEKSERREMAEFLATHGGQHGYERSLHSAIAAGDLKVVRRHVAAGADVDQVLRSQRPVGLALWGRHWDIAKFLLNRNCDVGPTPNGRDTPLHIAAAHGAPEPILAKLLKMGVDVNAHDSSAWTPLCHAAEAGDMDIVKWLLDQGADVTCGHEARSTPVYCALRGDHAELASFLIDRGGKSTLHQAVRCNHLARARQKLNAGADVNREEDPDNNDTPLEVAISLDSADMVALLLEFGADPNRQSASHNYDGSMFGGDTSLHEAVHMGSAKLVKLLLAHGADPNITNAAGLTPIELAHRKDRMHLASLMEAQIDKKLSLVEDQTGIQPLYTVSKVAELLSVDDNFVLDLVKGRKITGLQLDEKTLRITAGSIQRYLAKLSKYAPACPPPSPPGAAPMVGFRP